MAEVKISALPAATAALGADEIPVNEAGTTKKVTVTQLLALGLAVSAKAANFNAAAGNIYIVNTSGGAVSVQLPTPASGLLFIIKDKGSAATNNITLLRAASEKIEGVAASKVLSSDWGSWVVVSDGTDYFLA